MIKVDVHNIPAYMKECITEDFEDCGLFIDRETGDVHDIKELQHVKARVNIDRFKEAYLMVSKDF
jgi:hypothetical protein